VFFLHGTSLSPASLVQGAANWRLHLMVQSCTFILFPLLGLGFYFGGAALLPHDLRLGIYFLCAVCSTISSSVAMVAIARGNLAAAVFNASLSGLIGMVVTPALMSLVDVGGAGLPPLDKSIADIALKLLAPFVAGHLTRRFLLGVVTRHKVWVNRLDRAVIVLIVYTAFCQSTVDGVWSTFSVMTLVEIGLVISAILAAVLTVTTILAKIMKLSTEDEITAIFCGSKKSLANGAPIAKVLFAGSPALGAVLLPLMLYHQLQLIVCSVIARRYAERPRDALAGATAVNLGKGVTP
jgi:sodium/bile acid cotransporter 7